MRLGGEGSAIATKVSPVLTQLTQLYHVPQPSCFGKDAASDALVSEVAAIPPCPQLLVAPLDIAATTIHDTVSIATIAAPLSLKYPRSGSITSICYKNPHWEVSQNDHGNRALKVQSQEMDKVGILKNDDTAIVDTNRKSNLVRGNSQRVEISQ